MGPARAWFGALILVQAAHSIEEYGGRLYEVFPPARLASGAVSSDLERGFIIINVALVSLGAWCFLWPVRRGWSASRRSLRLRVKNSATSASSCHVVGTMNTYALL